MNSVATARSMYIVTKFESELILLNLKGLWKGHCYSNLMTIFKTKPEFK